MRQMGNLHPMKLLMAIKLSGSSSGPRICFFALYKEGSVNTKKLEAVWFSQRLNFLQTPTAGCCFLTCLEDSRPDIWWHFLYVAINDWVTAHLSLMCWRARRSQIFMKIVDFSFYNWIIIRRPKIVVEDSRCSWSLFVVTVSACSHDVYSSQPPYLLPGWGCISFWGLGLI